MTRGLQELEKILGVPLYERGPRGIAVTEFGTAFTGHARAVLAQLSQAERHVEEIADADRGQVVVGTHLAGSNLLLPRAIALLKREHPLVTVIVREATPENLLVELLSGRVDVVVGRLVHPRPAGTVHRVLHQESIRAVTGTHHPLAGSDRVELDMLVEYPWIVPGVETRLRQEIEELLTRHGLTVPADRVEATSFLTVRQLLVETRMVAVIPGLIAAGDPRLTPLPIALEPIGHDVGLTLAADRRLSPATQALIRSLTTAAEAVGHES
ncbi:LysR substrate-binding domain-containing protein [Amycolatopsis jiangsuensis]|uniref:DNA-binding transcriptional LysR family regulator n=1 Tax=Amycolatopsis jiangsuensis TaxID=1181879 RepID=A0A840J6E3_9PSEU|nr:LysR substrate-binding domain-containing protein [Amycolatopsis jiangsuensis]MBB4689269.1 DNA-binding transcriptional LysR family regulator [Amycolatopsis jiangsuensis]